jgi:hypothetical protein
MMPLFTTQLERALFYVCTQTASSCYAVMPCCLHCLQRCCVAAAAAVLALLVFELVQKLPCLERQLHSE